MAAEFHNLYTELSFFLIWLAKCKESAQIGFGAPPIWGVGCAKLLGFFAQSESVPLLPDSQAESAFV